MVKNIQIKKIREISNKAGLFFLLLLLIIRIFTEIILTINENNFNINIKAAEIVIRLISFIFPYFIMVKSMKKTVNDVISIKPPKKRLFSYVIVGLSIGYISGHILTCIVDFLKGYNIVSETPKELFEYDNTPIGIILFLIGGSIVPAISEEFVFRGVILGLLKKYGNGFAVVASALMFSLMHGNIEQIIFAFLLGLYLGFCVVKTKSIVPSVLIHFFNNLISGLVILFKDHPYCYYYTGAIVVFIIMSSCIILLSNFKNIKKLYHKKNKTESNLSFGKKMVTFIFTPGMILFFSYVAYALYCSLRGY